MVSRRGLSTGSSFVEREEIGVGLGNLGQECSEDRKKRGRSLGELTSP